jgi:hypothetical protein
MLEHKGPYFFFRDELRPPFRLADLPAFEMAAARDFGIPLRLRARYFFLFLTEFPAIETSP